MADATDGVEVWRGGVAPWECDEMGHMNVLWYAHLFGEAIGGFFALVGLTRDYMEANQAGTFALEQHTRFLRELRAGQHVTIARHLAGRRWPVTPSRACKKPSLHRRFSDFHRQSEVLTKRWHSGEYQ